MCPSGNTGRLHGHRRNCRDVTCWGKDAETAWGHQVEAMSGALKTEPYSKWQHTETRSGINMWLGL